VSLEWRVIKLEAQNGDFNTLLDEALAANITTPTIVFSKWKPTVSLGRAQSYALDSDANACSKIGASIVRRKSAGQSVYLDDGYVVISAVAPPGVLTTDVTHLSEAFAGTMVDTLQELGVPAEFYPPGNVVINGENMKQIGNCGQVVSNTGVFVHGSIRLSMNGLDDMLDALKVNGSKLQTYKGEIQNALASVGDYSQAGRDRVIDTFLNRFAERFGGTMIDGLLSSEEIQRINSMIEENHTDEWLIGEGHYKSQGVCYLCLNGRNLVPSMAPILPYKPVEEEVCRQ